MALLGLGVQLGLGRAILIHRPPLCMESGGLSRFLVSWDRKRQQAAEAWPPGAPLCAEWALLWTERAFERPFGPLAPGPRTWYES